MYCCCVYGFDVCLYVVLYVYCWVCGYVGDVRVLGLEYGFLHLPRWGVLSSEFMKWE